MTFETVARIIDDASYQASRVCGSEGLYQCIFYHVANACDQATGVEREVPVALPGGKTGKLDLVIRTRDVSVAVELKAGANSHRNSLDKAREVDKRFGAEKTGGVLKDLEKLAAFVGNSRDGPRRAISVCLETSFMKPGFTTENVTSYASLANARSIDFVYGTAGGNPKNLWSSGGVSREVVLEGAEEDAPKDLPIFDSTNFDWRGCLSEVEEAEPKDETFAQAIVYRYLRNLGLGVAQCASEVFFHFAKKSRTRASYWKPDLAVFDPEFGGRFNLGSNQEEKRQNDYEKLCNLNTIIEIKGSKLFESLTTNRKIKLIQEDLDKLQLHLRPVVERRIRNESIERRRPVDYAMVIVSADSGLNEYMNDVIEKYSRTVRIYWSGSYLVR